MPIALTRSVPPSIVDCELTPLEREPIDIVRASEQHARYERSLVALGCTIQRLPSLPDLPDSVFVEDAAVVLPELAILSRPGAASRRLEVTSVADALEPHRTLAFIKAPGTLDGGDVLRIGEVTHRSRQAEPLVQELKLRIEAVRDRTARSASQPRVACLEWFDPLYIAGHWVPEMVQIAGGNDMLGTAGAPSVKIEWEALIASRPEILILMPCGFDLERAVRESSLLRNRADWQMLPAVRDGRVSAVSGADYFSRPGPRLIDGLEILSQVIHPELSPAPISSDLAKRVNL